MQVRSPQSKREHSTARELQALPPSRGRGLLALALLPLPAAGLFLLLATGHAGGKGSEAL